MRMKVASEVAFKLHQEGALTFSPLTHNVPLDEISGAPNTDGVTWKRFNHELLSRCNRIMVIQMPGWDLSDGVKAEMDLADKLGIPISYIPCPSEAIQKWEFKLGSLV